MKIDIPHHLSDEDLMAALPGLAGNEREALARLIAHLAEVDGRRLYEPAGYSSLYIYCHAGLGFSEDAAYNRKAAAQVARRYPVVIEMLADGRLSLTAVRILAPVLADDNWEAALAEAVGLAKYEVEKIAARLKPKPDVPSMVRKLPTARSESRENETAVPERQAGTVVGGECHRTAANEGCAASAASPSTPRPLVAPLAPERYRVQFTIGEETEKKLRRLQQLLRREIPNGDPAVIFDRALDLLLAKVEGDKEGAVAKPRPARALKTGSRRVPSATRRVVVPRDGGQCTFVGTNGRRCTERVYLEYHHAGQPFACGGGPGSDNIALHCRAHNAYEGRRVFGNHLPRSIRDARVLYDATQFPVPERTP